VSQQQAKGWPGGPPYAGHQKNKQKTFKTNKERMTYTKHTQRFSPSEPEKLFLAGE